DSRLVLRLKSDSVIGDAQNEFVVFLLKRETCWWRIGRMRFNALKPGATHRALAGVNQQGQHNRKQFRASLFDDKGGIQPEDSHRATPLHRVKDINDDFQFTSGFLPRLGNVLFCRRVYHFAKPFEHGELQFDQRHRRNWIGSVLSTHGHNASGSLMKGCRFDCAFEMASGPPPHDIAPDVAFRDVFKNDHYSLDLIGPIRHALDPRPFADLHPNGFRSAREAMSLNPTVGWIVFDLSGPCSPVLQSVIDIPVYGI